MAARDPYRYINELDEATVQGLATRLEFRAADPGYVRMVDACLAWLQVPAGTRVLSVGCGTGVEARRLARRPGFAGQITGTDQSPALLATARRLAAEEGVAERVEFAVADALALDYADASFDAVLAVTLVSHIADPLAALREAARVVRPGGLVAIFDGDYASLTFGYSDAALARTMDEALIASIINNPRVMRDMPRLLRHAGLDLVESTAHIYADIGTGRFFPNLAQAYAPIVVRSGLVPAEEVERWRAEQERAAEDGTFFGASNYYAYLARRPNEA